MKKRTKTVFSRHIFESLKRYKQIDRGIIYDAIFNLIFDDVPIPKSLTPEQHLACTMFSMDLRRMTTQYENGKKARQKSDANSTGSFLMQDELIPNSSQNDPKFIPNSTQTSLDIIPLNKYKFKNIYNSNINQSIISRARARDFEKIEFFRTVNLEKIERLERAVRQSETMDEREVSKHLFNLETLSTLVNRVAKAPNTLHIGEEDLTPDEALERLLNIFRGYTERDVLQNIEHCFDKIELIDDSKISNRFLYTLAVLINGAVHL